MDKKNTTESPSNYNDLETKPVMELITYINQEDFSVAETVKQSLPQIE